MKILSMHPKAIQSREYRKKNLISAQKYTSKSAECAKKWREANKEYCIEYMAKYREENRESLYESRSKYRKIKMSIQENIEKNRAHQKIYQYLKKGAIKKPDECQVCKKSCRVEGHHHDYSKQFDVVWLCRSCHIEEHRKLKQIKKILKEQ